VSQGKRNISIKSWFCWSPALRINQNEVKNIILLFSLGLAGINAALSQQLINSRRFGDFFDEAYKLNPTIPRGILEGVAFANTGLFNVTHDPGDQVSCMGLPKVYGVMGLMDSGRNVFRSNLDTVALLSGYELSQIKSSVRINILAYARAYTRLLHDQFKVTNVRDQRPVLVALSELPIGNADNYPQEYQLYAVYRFLNDTYYQQLFRFPAYNIDLRMVFSEKNLRLLQAPFLNAAPGRAPAAANVDYEKATWVPAASCNFANGRTQPVSAIVIHDVEGSYHDCITWFKACPCPKAECGHCPSGTRGCDNDVPTGPSSAHYVVSQLGQVTQMVREADRAWHVGSENGYTIGIEHEGWCRSTYALSMYQASAQLVKDICRRHANIDPRTVYNGSGCPCKATGGCVKDKRFLVKGHQMYPNQTHTDPGPNWDWPTYYQLINKP
jgi:hypothetical protein